MPARRYPGCVVFYRVGLSLLPFRGFTRPCKLGFPLKSHMVFGYPVRADVRQNFIRPDPPLALFPTGADGGSQSRRLPLLRAHLISNASHITCATAVPVRKIPCPAFMNRCTTTPLRRPLSLFSSARRKSPPSWPVTTSRAIRKHYAAISRIARAVARWLSHDKRRRSGCILDYQSACSGSTYNNDSTSAVPTPSGMPALMAASLGYFAAISFRHSKKKQRSFVSLPPSLAHYPNFSAVAMLAQCFDPCPFRRSFPWARLRDNSCARQLPGFCFLGSSLCILWVPPRMQPLALGAVSTPPLGAPRKWGKKGEIKCI